MKTALCCSGKLNVVASEEEDEPCLCSAVTDNSAFSGEYAAVFDPLDGSSNIDTGLPTGTIIGVYRQPRYGATDPMSTVLQKGTELLFSCYCLYSASTHLVCTLGNGVHQFTLDDVSGEFYLTRSNIRMPSSGPVYSFNDANSAKWDPRITAYLDSFKKKVKNGVTDTSVKPVARYMGALVADAHNIMKKGGIFGYPGEMLKPNGKLRLLYEANPLAMIVEEAGGVASSGTQRILDIPVVDVHQRTPLFIGSRDDVRALEKYLQG